MKKTRKKWTFEEVKQYFSENGCVLLSTEYINTKQKLDYICSCKNPSKITFTHFKNGVRCKECSNKRGKEKLKLNFDDVKKLYDEKGCILLENEYINNHTPMKYICHCGELAESTYVSFKKSKYCMSCCGKKKFDYQFVYDYFKERGCTLLEKEYINNKTPMKYICDCGNPSNITFNNFKNGQRCGICANNQKYTYEYIFNYFKENDCLLLSFEYINNGQDLEYLCSCGNKSTIKFRDFQNGHRCWECGQIKKGEKLRKYDIEFVRDFLNNLGCTLLSTEYHDLFQMLDYRCACGNKDKKRFANFLYDNQLCMKCSGERSAEKTRGVPKPQLSGENNPNWQGGKSKIQEYLRSRISEWKYESAKTFDFKCIVSGNKFDVVHHLQSFNLIVNEALDKLSLPIHEEINKYSQSELEELSNEVSKLHYKYGFGLPLSNEIHNDFHSKYGLGGNSIDQFIKYINEYHPQINISLILKTAKAVA
jgi:hypothetical protein